MVRVLVWGTRGPRFESALPDSRPRWQSGAAGGGGAAPSGKHQGADAGPPRPLYVAYVAVRPEQEQLFRTAGFLKEIVRNTELNFAIYKQTVRP